MNLPDTAEARGLECAEQNTRGESSPAHFSVTKDLAEESVSDRAACPPSAKCRFGHFLVLFRHNRPPKLMQKIHRLTDN
jgi:hypothetical protein